MVHTTSKSLGALRLGLVLAVLAPLAAQAQGTPPKVVTRDELRACMDSESDLVRQRAALDARRKQIGEEAAAIRAEDSELAQEQQRVEEQTMPMARDRFARKVRQHNARITAAKQQEDAVRTGFEDLGKAMDAYNARCAGIAFKPEDKAAILKERESQPK